MIPIRPENSKFTIQQWQAIYDDSDNILVSASAGSGKTTVLTTRIIEKLKRYDNINELLIVTYTNSAAKEMKERIEHALHNEINQTIDADLRRHLQQQITLLPQANISTIHAFCLTVIRKYFYLIDVDPNFRLMSSDIDIQLLKDEVWQNLKEQLYKEEAFIEIAKAYAGDKYDNSLDELVYQLYEFSIASPMPEKWLNNISNLYEENNIVNSQLYQQLILPSVKTSLEDCIMLLQQSEKELEHIPELEKNYINTKNDIAQLKDLVSHLNDNYDELYTLFQSFKFERFAVVKTIDDENLKKIRENIQLQRKSIKKEIDAITTNFFNGTQERQLTLLKGAKNQIITLSKVVQRFLQAYKQTKMDNGVLEFSDLEHITLQLLQQDIVCQFYQQQFKEILVDEYQDINQLQEAIIQKLSNGHNLFMVGDVKQSIYAFRLSDPNLFLNKYLAYKNNNGGKCILLKENFRSRSHILSGINFIFQQLMDVTVGGMVYDEDAMLKHGNTTYQKEENYNMTLLLYEAESDQTDSKNLSKELIEDNIDGEIYSVAEQIRRMIHDKFQVTDQGTFKDVTYQDIALILPTGKYNNRIQEIFKLYDIPVNLVDEETYFERSEVLIMISILKLIDNPYQDIPVVSFLRSPIIQMNDNELAAIRINQNTGQYYEATQKFILDFEQGNIQDTKFYKQIWQKLTKFNTLLTKWRTFIKSASLVELIWEIYNDTLFLDYVLGLPNGQQRQENLYELYHYAKSYEKNNIKSLFQFINFLDKLQQRDFALNEAKIQYEQNAVEVMTIHKSKGLEFPVVFLCGISGEFNKQDLKSTVLLEDYGLGTYYYQFDKKYKYKTLVQKSLERFKDKKLLAEEMRKLYVALTRAKEQLYIVGRIKSKDVFYQQFSQFVTFSKVTLPSLTRVKAKNFLMWLSYSMLRSKSIQQEYYNVENLPYELAKHKEKFNIVFTNVQQFKPSKEKKQQHKNLIVEKEVDIQPIINVIQYQYPYDSETKTTTYQSVSELKRLVEDPLVTELTAQQTSGRYVHHTLATPKFLQKEDKITNAIIGTATHRVLQTLPLEGCITEKKIVEHIDKLVQQNILTESVAKYINVYDLVRFFESELGRNILKDSRLVKREVPFSAVVKAKQLFNDIKADDDILIHGIIDGYIEYEKSIVLYDFKTDKVDDKNLNQVIQKYKSQLQIYANILSNLTNKNVEALYLCLLNYGKNINLNKM